jgi:hypothetical protein
MRKKGALVEINFHRDHDVCPYLFLGGIKNATITSNRYSQSWKINMEKKEPSFDKNLLRYVQEKKEKNR